MLVQHLCACRAVVRVPLYLLKGNQQGPPCYHLLQWLSVGQRHTDIQLPCVTAQCLKLSNIKVL